MSAGKTIMKFTYESYRNLIKMLKLHGYRICDYADDGVAEKTAVLRHDIDFSVDKALVLSDIEREEGVCATYFVLVSTDFYNIHSKRTVEKLKALADNGGVIGLHFDETRYDIDNEHQMISVILKEREILQTVLEMPVETVSMHRPSQKMISKSIEIPGMINAYDERFFKEYKYVSDSRMHWREDVEKLVESGEYNRLHILTHAFWYHDREKNMKEILTQFIRNAKAERYESLTENLRDINELLKKEEI